MTSSASPPASWSDVRQVVSPELGRVSFSSTFVYRLPPEEFASKTAALRERFGDLADGLAMADFAAIRGSVVEMMPTAGLLRLELPLEVLSTGAGLLPGLLARVSEIASFLSIAETYNTVSLTINFYFPTASVDELIALSHSCYGRRAASQMQIRLDSATISGHSLGELHKQLADQLAISSSDQITDQFRCVEIRDVESLVDADAALRTHSPAMYGVLLGDEGWRHVPQTVTDLVLKNKWGTRSFVAVVGSGDGCLALNLRPRAFSTSQQKFFVGFFDAELPYFSHQFKLASVDHGPFFAMELCSYRKCVVDDLRRELERRGSAPSPPSVLGGIRHRAYRRSLYNELTQGLRRLQLNRMTELAALDNAVEAGSGLPDRLARLNELVQAFEEEEQVAYMYRVNSTMAAIAWITLTVAVFGAVLTVLALVTAL